MILHDTDTKQMHIALVTSNQFVQSYRILSLQGEIQVLQKSKQKTCAPSRQPCQQQSNKASYLRHPGFHVFSSTWFCVICFCSSSPFSIRLLLIRILSIPHPLPLQLAGGRVTSEEIRAPHWRGRGREVIGWRARASNYVVMRCDQVFYCCGERIGM